MNISHDKYRKELSAFYRMGYLTANNYAIKKIEWVVAQVTDSRLEKELNNIISSMKKINYTEEDMKKLLKEVDQ